MSLQAVLASFKAKELESMLKLAKSADMFFFHLRGHEGRLCFSDLSYDGSRFLRIVFKKETSLEWGEVKGAIEVRDAYTKMRWYRQEGGDGDDEIIYAEFEDGGLSLGVIRGSLDGLEAEIYQGGSFRNSYTAENREKNLRFASQIPPNIPKPPKASFRIGLTRLLKAIKGTRLILFTAEDGQVAVRNVKILQTEDDLEEPQLIIGENRPLGVMSDISFTNMLYGTELMLKFLNALHRVASDAVVTASINSKGHFAIEEAETPIGSVTYVQAPLIMKSVVSSFDGVERRYE